MMIRAFFHLTFAILATISGLSSVYFHSLITKMQRIQISASLPLTDIQYYILIMTFTLYNTVFANFRCDGLVESAHSVVALKLHSLDDSSAGIIL